MLNILSHKATNLFDIMAKIFKKIDSLPTIEEKERIYQRCQSNIASLDQTVEERFSFFNKCEITLFHDSLNDVNLLTLSSYIDRENEYDCFLVLVYLDRYIQFELSMRRFFDICESWQKGIYSFDSLNKNGIGVLLPRFTPEWAKINNVTRDACNAKPFSLIKHYMWCADCEDMEVNHIYVDINPLEKNDMEEPFRIVCSPIVDKRPFEYYTARNNDTDYFYIHDYPQAMQDVILARIKETFRYAGEMRASIVFFPEMMIAPENQNIIIQMIKENWEYDYPKIIYLPSSEYKDGDKWKNQIIVTNDSGDILYEYNKQRGYQYPVKNEDGTVQKICFEPIVPDKKFTVLHLNKIGRVGMLICADIFDDAIKANLCSKYDLDMLLVAAYTSGWDLFDRCAHGMSDTCCEVIICNTCSAIENKSRDDVYPVAYYPLGHKSKRPHEKKKCEGDCSGCAFCVDISNGYKDIITDPLTQKRFEGGG